MVIELKGEINSNTIKVGDINIPLLTMNILSRQKINKEKADLNNTIMQMDLIHIYRTTYPISEYTLL